MQNINRVTNDTNNNEKKYNDKEQKTGITVIALTIIVIVIIALIIILIVKNGSSNNAMYAKFTQEFDSFTESVKEQALNIETYSTVKGNKPSGKQMYNMIANNVDIDRVNSIPATGKMEDIKAEIKPQGITGTEFYEIKDKGSISIYYEDTYFYDSNEKIYITDTGEVFTLPGLYLKVDGEMRRFISPSKYYVGDPITIDNNKPEQINIEYETLGSGDENSI